MAKQDPIIAAYLDEKASTYLYQALSEVEKDPRLAEVYARIAKTEIHNEYGAIPDGPIRPFAELSLAGKPHHPAALEDNPRQHTGHRLDQSDPSILRLGVRQPPNHRRLGSAAWVV